MGKLDGKIALITGSSQGIGFATAQRFIIEGAEYVFITGRRKEALDKAVQQIGSKNVTAVQGDASNLTDLDELYSIIQKEKGRLDIVFSNVGTGSFTPLGSITEKYFDDILNTNVKATLFTIQKALPLLVDGGSIILNGSYASLKGIPATSVYCATKAALHSFARCWTIDLKERKIRVNIVSLGVIDTSVLDDIGTSQEKEMFLANVKAATPMNRIGMPDDVAKAVVFLASDESSYIIGIELFVDGGIAQI